MVASAGGLQVDLTLESRAFLRDIRRSQREISSAAMGMRRDFQNVSSAAAFMSRTLIAAFTVRQIGLFVRDIAKAGEKVNVLRGQMTALTGSAARGADAVEKVFGIVSRTGQQLDGTITQFARFTIALDNITNSNEDVGRFVETLQKLGRLSGGTAQEITAASIQLSQGLAKGRLDGEELRSVLEQMPLVARAIADELGVGVGQLRDLGKEGQLTADVVFNAILDRSKDIDAQFAELPTTIEQAGNSLSAVWTQLEAQLDDVLGVSRAIVGTLEGAAAFIGVISSGMDRVFNTSIDEQLRARVSELRDVQNLLAEGAATGLSATPMGQEFTQRLSERRAALQAEIRTLQEAIDLRAELGSVSATPIDPSGGGGGGGSTGRSFDDVIDASMRRANAMRDERAQVGLLGEELFRLTERQRLLNDIQRAGIQLTPEIEEAINRLSESFGAQAAATEQAKNEHEAWLKSLEENQRAIDERNREVEQSVGQVGSAFESAFERAILRGDDLRGVIQGLAQDLARMASQKLFQQLFGAVTGSLFGGGAVAGSAFDTAASPVNVGAIDFFKSAKGNAFDRSGLVTAFASGGVVNGATPFGFNGGQGLMGEAGPEAILPLERDARGRLGVIASGGGGTQINLNSTVNAGGGTDTAALRRALDERDRVLLGQVADVVRAEQRRKPQSFR